MLPYVRLQDRVEVLELSVSDEANYEHLSLTIDQLNTAHTAAHCDLRRRHVGYNFARQPVSLVVISTSFHT